MNESNTPSAAQPGPQCVEASGPWPFVTRRIHRGVDGALAVWSSRHHRKRLVLPEAAKAIAITETLLRCLWMPRKLNWWIGTIFAVGSLLFAVASVLCLSPALAKAWSLDSTGINAIFFAGSIPFTTAAYLQLFQAANAGPLPGNPARSGQRVSLFGWRPHDIGWLSCALQFIGTILFNFNTFDAMIPSLTWFQQDLLIWVPNIVGSILFLASGHLAFIETCHAHWSWHPKSISWWVVFTNLLGCVGFMISAVFAIFLPGPANTEAVTISVLFTLLGAIGFLVGSLLMLPEAVFHEEQ
jgi:hypothetical protein